MEIDSQALTTCDVSQDGRAISLGFVDTTGNPATIRLSLDQAGALLMTLPGLIDRALLSCCWSSLGYLSGSQFIL